jgi:hypothetical protein
MATAITGEAALEEGEEPGKQAAVLLRQSGPHEGCLNGLLGCCNAFRSRRRL